MLDFSFFTMTLLLTGVHTYLALFHPLKLIRLQRSRLLYMRMNLSAKMFDREAGQRLYIRLGRVIGLFTFALCLIGWVILLARALNGLQVQ